MNRTSLISGLRDVTKYLHNCNNEFVSIEIKDYGNLNLDFLIEDEAYYQIYGIETDDRAKEVLFEPDTDEDDFIIARYYDN